MDNVGIAHVNYSRDIVICLKCCESWQLEVICCFWHISCQQVRTMMMMFRRLGRRQMSHFCALAMKFFDYVGLLINYTLYVSYLQSDHGNSNSKGIEKLFKFTRFLEFC